MESTPRYELLNIIAAGDFATVYRARDRELGREVAVKQIHQQFLHDERQLSRYWHEAQLLASLQHPHILTIYDIVRKRGWLILELMQTNLQQMTRGEPIDLDFLRSALTGCLSALHLLHANGLIHGDIKPSNMLVDVQGRVKLGDFGLARRAGNQEGSLLKGTTKYMAPELVSDQFGPVGPASDLYSLGFSAYELLCGAQFEQLFPGLATFGRDKQIAWMMWHAAADRNLPEIGRVLENVPEDLARVVQRMVVKDQSQRYKSASEAIHDLPIDPRLAPPPPPQEDAVAMAEQEAAARKKRNLRLAAVGSLVASVVLCLVLLLPDGQQPQVAHPSEPTRGTITSVFPDESRLVVLAKEEGGNVAKTIEFNRFAVFYLNDASCVLEDLKSEDQVRIEDIRDKAGRKTLEIRAYRPLVSQGRVVDIKPDEGIFTLALDDAGSQGKMLDIEVPRELKIVFNGNKSPLSESFSLREIKQGDRVLVHHVGGSEESGHASALRKATALNVERRLTAEGVVRLQTDKKTKELTLGLGSKDNPNDMILPLLPFAPDCEITIKGQRLLNSKLIKPADLRDGDKATVQYDTLVRSVDAYQLLHEAGTIRRAQYEARTIDVALGSGEKTYVIGDQCRITLGGEQAELGDLRDGDRVEITHDSPGARVPEAVAVSATRQSDPSRWALLIGNKNYDDRTLSPLAYTVEDAKLLRDALVKRYQVPAEQAEIFSDETRLRLEQGITDRLRKLSAESKLIVYIASHAYKDDDGQVYLALKDFDFKRIGATGVSLQWLVDELENCPAKEKLLLLDCCQAGLGADLAKEPSTAEMIELLKTKPGRVKLRTVTAVVSCKAGQRAQVLPDKQHGLFAWELAEGFSGRADKNRDNRLEPTELFTYLGNAMTVEASQRRIVQNPELFLPNDRPPRISEEAKKALLALAAYQNQDRARPPGQEDAYNQALSLSGKEPEPNVLYGLLLLKQRQRDPAMKIFGEVNADRPEMLIPLQALAWLQFDRRSYDAGVRELKRLIAAIPIPRNPAVAYPPEVQQIFIWAGQLREFAAAVVDKPQPKTETLADLDQTVAARGAEAKRLYQQGRDGTQSKIADFDKKIAEAGEGSKADQLKTERRLLARYASFPLEEAFKQILDGLDQ
jgi:eukaryotic-like serine/threonine-protein kinase